MAYWLFKEEPTHYSYEDLERDGQTVWDGVRKTSYIKGTDPSIAGILEKTVGGRPSARTLLVLINLAAVFIIFIIVVVRRKRRAKTN